MTNLALNYLQHAMKSAATWKLLKPHVPALMQRVLFPLMCFADEDQELWDDDPHEYVRKVGGGAWAPGPVAVHTPLRTEYR